MICKSCGAEFSADLLLCPYCGAENEKEAKEQQEEYIEQVKRKMDSVQDIPDQMAKKANGWLTKVVVGIVLLAVVALVIAMIVTKILDVTSLQRQQRKLDKLEALYQAEDYTGLQQYLLDAEEYGGEFQKYEVIARLYSDCETTVDLLRAYHNVVESNPESKIVDDYEDNLKDVMADLQYIDELEQNGFVYGEEKVVFKVREAYMQALKDYLLLTEDEIVAAQARYTEGKGDYSQFKKLTLNRMLQ